LALLLAELAELVAAARIDFARRSEVDCVAQTGSDCDDALIRVDRRRAADQHVLAAEPELPVVVLAPAVHADFLRKPLVQSFWRCRIDTIFFNTARWRRR
jgi:hypothetical protein